MTVGSTYSDAKIINNTILPGWACLSTPATFTDWLLSSRADYCAGKRPSNVFQSMKWRPIGVTIHQGKGGSTSIGIMSSAGCLRGSHLQLLPLDLDAVLLAFLCQPLLKLCQAFALRPQPQAALPLNVHEALAELLLGHHVAAASIHRAAGGGQEVCGVGSLSTWCKLLRLSHLKSLLPRDMSGAHPGIAVERGSWQGVSPSGGSTVAHCSS